MTELILLGAVTVGIAGVVGALLWYALASERPVNPDSRLDSR